MSLNFLATRFQCSWPWSTLVMLCDGRIVCGCADPYGKRVLGDARQASVHEIWTGPVVSGVQKRVETMLTMTGAQNFLEIHADEPTAVKSFGA